MNRMFILLVLGAFSLPVSEPVMAEPACLLCEPRASTAEADKPKRPIRIEIESSLDFSRVARTGGAGSVDLDPRTGQRRVVGGLADLGGLALRGTVRVTGEPFASVRISLPDRVTLRGAQGGNAEVTQIQTDSSDVARFDSGGQLVFSFGGRLVVSGPLTGTVRGSVPFSVDYE